MTVMNKKLYIGTNTKMTKGIADTVSFLKALQSLTEDISREDIELFVIPSYTALERARKSVTAGLIRLGAQNMCWEEQGQFTGEISPLMLQETGTEIIEIGHSERRHIFGETDEHINKKVLSALKHGFTALLCIGETAREKELNIGSERLAAQLKTGLHQVAEKDLERLWVAYEPVWAIGTQGVPASATYAEDKHGKIKVELTALFGKAAQDIPVLYGGSVTLENSLEFIQMPSIDGLFIGRSAWEADNFNQIIRQTLPLFKNKNYF